MAFKPRARADRVLEASLGTRFRRGVSRQMSGMLRGAGPSSHTRGDHGPRRHCGDDWPFSSLHATEEFGTRQDGHNFFLETLFDGHAHNRSRYGTPYFGRCDRSIGSARDGLSSAGRFVTVKSRHRGPPWRGGLDATPQISRRYGKGPNQRRRDASPLTCRKMRAVAQSMRRDIWRTRRCCRIAFLAPRVVPCHLNDGVRSRFPVL
jgi:hypothetical protein